MISSAIWNKEARVNFLKDYKLHSPYGLVQFWSSLKKVTSAYLFQIAREKSRDYLLITYMKKFEVVKQKKRTRITRSGKNCVIKITPSKARAWFESKRFEWFFQNRIVY